VFFSARFFDLSPAMVRRYLDAPSEMQ
jgi:hypothetical protein